MWGRLRRKKKEKEERQEKLPFGEKDKRSQKKTEGTGPRWGALVVIALSVAAGLFFWVYGNFEDLESGKIQIGFEWKQLGGRDLPLVTENEEGLIIFEKGK